jgi:hypothetical protein
MANCVPDCEADGSLRRCSIHAEAAPRPQRGFGVVFEVGVETVGGGRRTTMRSAATSSTGMSRCRSPLSCGFVDMLGVTIGDIVADPKIVAHHISRS